MADVFSKQTRSEVMRAVKSSGNRSTELRLISAFREHKITGWRRNYSLFGKPDFVFPKKKLAVFCDGCFWHGHGCRNLSPKQNADYWQEKIAKNKKRDRKVSRELRSRGWEVVRIWECEIANGKYVKKLAKIK